MPLVLLTSVACLGGGNDPEPTPTPRPSAIDRLRATPQRVPTEEPAPRTVPSVPAVPAIPGSTSGTSVSTSLSASCRLGASGPELIVEYGARISGANLSRVQLLDNGSVLDDSGPLSRNEFSKTVTKPAEAGSGHRLELKLDAPGMVAPSVQSFTTCPSR